MISPYHSPEPIYQKAEATRMTVALPIWEASNILTQTDLAWAKDSNAGSFFNNKRVGMVQDLSILGY